MTKFLYCKGAAHADADFSYLVARIEVTKALLEQLLSFMSLAETVADMNAQEGGFYKVVFWNSEPDWFDYKDDLDEEQEAAYFSGDWFSDFGSPEHLNWNNALVWNELSMLHVTPGSARWTMVVKHTSVECETARLTREQVEKLLDESTD